MRRCVPGVELAAATAEGHTATYESLEVIVIVVFVLVLSLTFILVILHLVDISHLLFFLLKPFRNGCFVEVR
jgi:hypothetical protein